MSTAQYRQCAHPGCACTVSEGQQYCSTYCQQHGQGRQQQAQGASSGQAASSPHGCGCGHTACQHS
jgi:hypothetical protein